MIDVFIQLIRNGLCCIKDFYFLKIYLPNIYNKLHILNYYPFIYISHVEKTTFMDFIISLTQLFGCIYYIWKGYFLITSNGFLKLMKLNRFKYLRMKYIANKAIRAKYINKERNDKVNKENDTSNNTKINNPIFSESEISSDQIICHYIIKEADSAFQNTIIGISYTVTGIGFFWLAVNSLHITKTDCIGGYPSFIHYLILMKLALSLRLYYMIQNGNKKSATSKRMKLFSIELKSKSGIKRLENIDSYHFSWLHIYGIWVPFCSPSFGKDISEQEKYDKEIEYIINAIESLSKTPREREKDYAIFFGQTANKTSKQLEDKSNVMKWKGLCDYFFFSLNLVAFYGYLIEILCYYFNENDDQYLSCVLLGWSCMNAQWRGNIVRDLVWTIEALIIIVSYVICTHFTGNDYQKNKTL